MNKISAKNSAYLVFSILVACLAVGTVAFAVWKTPSATPPDKNADAPINVSGTAQGKLGSLTLGTTSQGANITVYGGGIFSSSATKLDISAYDSGSAACPNNACGSIDAQNTAGTKIPLVLNAWGGNVGIGTTTPTTTLDVRGTLHLEDANQAGVLTFSGADPVSGKYPNLFIRSVKNGTYTDRMFISGSTGNVGIGTTAPAKKLEIVGGATKTTGGLIIQTCTPTGTGDGLCPTVSNAVVGQMWLDTSVNGN